MNCRHLNGRENHPRLSEQLLQGDARHAGDCGRNCSIGWAMPGCCCIRPPGSHRECVEPISGGAGIDPDRLELIGRVSAAGEYFRTYHRMDIALDPFPFCGGTTTCDALWMGVPVVTLAGRTAVGRAG